MGITDAIWGAGFLERHADGRAGRSWIQLQRIN